MSESPFSDPVVPVVSEDPVLTEVENLEAGRAPESVEGFELPELLPEEQPEEYFARLTQILRDRTERIERFSNGVNIQGTLGNDAIMCRAIEKIDQEYHEVKFSEQKRRHVRDQAETAFGPGYQTALEDEHTGLSFEHTNAARPFADITTDSRGVPYSQSMFGLYYEADSTTPEIIQQYFESKINGKTIMLLGGGDSVSDIISPLVITEEHRISTGVSAKSLHPKKIINVDKYLKTERIEKGDLKDEQGKSIYLSLPVLAQDTEGVLRGLETAGVEQVDEIWASYSVPFYLEDMKELEGVLDTIKKTLAPGGSARITPLAMQISLTGILKLGQTRKEFAALVDSFNADPLFNAYVFADGATETLVIRRLKSEA